MFDVLGFKRLVQKKDIDQIHQIMHNLFDSFNKGVNRNFMIAVVPGGSPPPRPNPYNTFPTVRLDHFIFSDTILVWKDVEILNGDHDKVLKVGCEEFKHICRGLCLIMDFATQARIPLRGGIAFGETIINIDGKNNEIIGQPIVNAYLVEEAQQWIGVAFHSSCLPFLEKCGIFLKKKEIPYDKKRLCAIEDGYATDFSVEWGGMDEARKSLVEMRNELLQNGSSQGIIDKYERTIEFVKDHEVPWI